MHTSTKLAKWGNSLGIRIPKHLATEIGLDEGALIEVFSRENELVVRRRSPAKRYDLGDLLTQITPENQHSAVDWGPDTGGEVW